MVGSHQLWQPNAAGRRKRPTLVEWSPLPYYGPRPITEAIFSPHRRSRRMIYQQARRLVALQRRGDGDRVRIVTSAPYLHLLGCVTREATRPGPGWGLQFQVVREAHDPGREFRVAVFKSAIHELDP